MDFLRRLLHPEPERNLPLIIGTTIGTTLILGNLARIALQGTGPKIIRSPTTSLLPRLSPDEVEDLPYPPNILPGGRNVSTPYGVMRVYEWGPEDGRKVLLIHGISTPCIALGGIAHALVERGCRVMIYDLWGRGYTDSCADLQHDDRLYSTQIFLAVTSSSLSWIGGDGGGFSIIGYSMGGGIAANFTSYFSHMVKDLVLLAPAGLIRAKHMSARSKFLYSTGFLPESVLQWAVRRRLREPMYKNENSADEVEIEEKKRKTDVRDAVTAEARHPKGGAEFSYQDAPLSKSKPNVTVLGAVQWQLKEHEGFVHSFMSSIRFAPITGQQEAWKRLGELRQDKILIFAGTKDPIIFVEELREDAIEALTAEKIDYRVIEGAHDFPIVSAEEVVEKIWDVWAA